MVQIFISSIKTITYDTNFSTENDILLCIGEEITTTFLMNRTFKLYDNSICAVIKYKFICLLSLYTCQSTYAIRKRHIIAVLNISKPWKWKKKKNKKKKKSFGFIGQVVSEKKICLNRPIRNNNCLWWSCLLTNRN
jgi:hypothetical protein